MTTAVTVNVAETRSPPATPALGEDVSAEQLLAALPSAVGSAQRFVRHTLELWQLDDLADTAEALIVTLVVDAVARTGVLVEHPGFADLYGKPVNLVLVRLRALDDRVLIEVHDEDATPPWTRDSTEFVPNPVQSSPGAPAVTYDMVSSAGTIAHVELDTPPAQQQNRAQLPGLPHRVPGRNLRSSSGPVEAERDPDLLRRVQIGLQQIPIHRPTMPATVIEGLSLDAEITTT